MANNTYKKNLNLVASSINSLNLSGDGHVYGQLYCEDITVNDTLITENVVVNDHLTTPVINTDEINTDTIQVLNGTQIKIKNELNMASNKISNLTGPVKDSDAATREYVDTGDAATRDYVDTSISNINITIPSNLLSNPLTSDLDADENNIINFNNLDGKSTGSSITNITNIVAPNNNPIQLLPSITTGMIQTDVMNKTETPTYVYFGNITPGNYVIAEIPDLTKAEGDITVHIRCLEPGKKQTVVFNCIALPEKATITVLSHTHENSVLPPQITVSTLFYGTVNPSISNNIGYLGFICSNVNTANTKVEISIYQNQTDKGDGQPYGSGFIPVTSIISSALINNFIASYIFELDSQIGTTGNMMIKGGVSVKEDVSVQGDISVKGDISVQGDGTVNKLSVNIIDKSTGNFISFNNNQLSGISSITATSLTTNSITSSLNAIDLNGKNLTTVGNIVMNNSNIVGASDVQLSTISGQNNNTISVNSPLNLGSNKITTTSVPTTDYDVTNKLFVENKSFFETNGNNIYTKTSVNNIGLGVINPGHKLEVNGDTRVIGNARQTSSTTDGVTYITNSQTNAEGLNNFRVYPSSSNSTTVYKRVSAFNKTFTTSNQIFSVTIPDCLFYPNSGFYSKGVGMVKICYSCIGFTDQGQTLPGGIQYREIIVICRPRSVGLSESVVMDTHELVNKTTVKQGDTSMVYVVTNPRNVSLEGSNSGTVNSGSLNIGTDFALGVDFISQNIPLSSQKAILKGTIEAI